jgi:DNA-binding transcriptional LysR family regulator
MRWDQVGFDWNRVRAFLVSAETGSFSAAARALQVSQPTISRQIAALEARLGVTLFERTTGRLSTTDAGLDLLEQARAMGAAALRFSLTATGQATAIEGTVSVTASETVAAFLLPPTLARLRAEQPGIRIDIIASIAVQDLQRREADIALRNGRPQGADLIARKIRTDTASVFATPDWIARHGPFETPADLHRLELFAFDRTDNLIDGLKAFGLTLTQAHFPIATGNQLVQWSLCKQGIGACLMMDVVGDAEPAVVRLLPQVRIPVPMWLVCHRELRTSRRIRLVYDRLAEMLTH